MARLHLGTSGWTYGHWRGAFYPAGLPQRSWLEFYTRHFDTVEINFSFYRLPAESTFASWRARTPDGFRFSVKGSRYVTHLKRLAGTTDSVERLAARVDKLGDRAGPILWQLPPDLERDDQRLEAFLDSLPARFRHVFEFRHPSWMADAVFERLRTHGAALCIADRDGRHDPLVTTSDWAYLRFHAGLEGGSYTDAQLDEWAGRILDLNRCGDIWMYFNNDWNAYAIANAQALKGRLGLAALPAAG